MDELRVTSDIEQQKAKEFAAAVQKLQVAIKREQQIKVLKHVNEKQKTTKVGVEIAISKYFRVQMNCSSFRQKNPQHGLLGQLQSQLQSSSADNVHQDNDANVPESWKWQNQQNIKERRERKNKTQRQKNKTQAGKNAEATNGAADDGATPAKRGKFAKSSDK